MKSSKGVGGTNLHEGMKNMSPKGDGIAKAPPNNMDSDATRSSVAKSHSLGGRVA
jgi:hypothetical protein